MKTMAVLYEDRGCIVWTAVTCLCKVSGTFRVELAQLLSVAGWGFRLALYVTGDITITPHIHGDITIAPMFMVISL